MDPHHVCKSELDPHKNEKPEPECGFAKSKEVGHTSVSTCKAVDAGNWAIETHPGVWGLTKEPRRLTEESWEGLQARYITLTRSRIQIHIKVKRRIRIRIKVKRRIQIRIRIFDKVKNRIRIAPSLMRIRKTGSDQLKIVTWSRVPWVTKSWAGSWENSLFCFSWKDLWPHSSTEQDRRP